MSTFLAWMSPIVQRRGLTCQQIRTRALSAARVNRGQLFWDIAKQRQHLQMQFSEAGLLRVCGDRARSATHIRERVPDPISQATTLALVEEPSSGSDASALGSPRSMGGIRAVNRGTPEDSAAHQQVFSNSVEFEEMQRSQNLRCFPACESVKPNFQFVFGHGSTPGRPVEKHSWLKQEQFPSTCSSQGFRRANLLRSQQHGVPVRASQKEWDAPHHYCPSFKH